jgi:hypothetical protein
MTKAPTATKPRLVGILFTLLAAGAGCSSSGVKVRGTGGAAVSNLGGTTLVIAGTGGGSTGGLLGTGGAAGGRAGTGGALGTGGATSTSSAPGMGGAVGVGGAVPGVGGLVGTGGRSTANGGTATGTGGVGSGGTISGSGGSAAACVGDTSNLGPLGFKATPAVIAPGQSSTLSWYWSTAPSLTIDQGIGMVMGKGSHVVTPTQTTTYTLTQAMSADLRVQDKVTVVVTDKGFKRTGSLSVARSKHTATLLADGKVIVVGGSSLGQPLASAEIYDPMGGTFTAAKDMAQRRVGHTATLLGDGKVLVVGGESGATAEIYDPASQGFAPTGNPTVARVSHTATLLADGQVLIAGGTGNGGGLTSAEIYNPVTGSFSAVGAMTVGRYEHAAVRLASGKVLLVGGNAPASITNNDGLSSAELYDPGTASFTATGNMTSKRAAPVIALLEDDTVLVGGGVHGFEGYFDSNSLESYEPTAGTFAATGNLAVKRALFSMTRLADGSVFMAGGLQHHNGAADSYLANAESYAPAARISTLAACMSVERYLHTATLLADGRVLVVGGRRSNLDLADAELY